MEDGADHPRAGINNGVHEESLAIPRDDVLVIGRITSIHANVKQRHGCAEVTWPIPWRQLKRYRVQQAARGDEVQLGAVAPPSGLRAAVERHPLPRPLTTERLYVDLETARLIRLVGDPGPVR